MRAKLTITYQRPDGRRAEVSEYVREWDHVHERIRKGHLGDVLGDLFERLANELETNSHSVETLEVCSHPEIHLSLYRGLACLVCGEWLMEEPKLGR